MKEYMIQVWGLDGALYAYGNFHGANAIEVFEKAFAAGQLHLPYGEEVEIVSTCLETSLNIKFRAQGC